MLYFAYGSNLHHFQMKRRCKDSVYLKKINLKGFRLTFRSKYRAADIEQKKIQLFQEGYLRYLKVMKKNLMYMKIIQIYIRNIIFSIIVKK